MTKLFLFLSLLIPEICKAEIIVYAVDGVSSKNNYRSSTQTPGIQLEVRAGFAGSDTVCTAAELTATTTCNSCTSSPFGSNMSSCNKRRAHPALELSITFESTAKKGAVTFDIPTTGTPLHVSPDNSIIPTTGFNQKVSAKIRWGSLCDKFQTAALGTTTNSATCVGYENKQQQFRVGIDGNNNGTLGDADDDALTFLVIVNNPSGTNATHDAYTTIATCQTDGGVCNFHLEPGDTKANITYTDIRSLVGEGSRPISNIIFYAQENTGFASITTDNVRAEVPVQNNIITKDVIDGLTNGITYFFYAATEDDTGNISRFLALENRECESASPNFPDCRQIKPDAVYGLFANKQNCFIATAAYGSPLEKHVKTLRKFRDEVLVDNWMGRLFIKTYYTVSPSIARWISASSERRYYTRIALSPIVWFVSFSMEHYIFLIFALIFTTALFIFKILQKRLS